MEVLGCLLVSSKSLLIVCVETTTGPKKKEKEEETNQLLMRLTTKFLLTKFPESQLKDKFLWLLAFRSMTKTRGKNFLLRTSVTIAFQLLRHGQWPEATRTFFSIHRSLQTPGNNNQSSVQINVYMIFWGRRMIAAFDTSLASETVSQLCKINDRQWGKHRNAFVSTAKLRSLALRYRTMYDIYGIYHCIRGLLNIK